VFGSSGEFHIRGCLEPVESPQKKTKRMPWLQLCRTNLPKNSGRASEKARNHGSHLQWEAGAQPGGGHLGHLPPHRNFKTLHGKFDICRDFQRIKMKYYILINFKKSCWNFSLSCLLIIISLQDLS